MAKKRSSTAATSTTASRNAARSGARRDLELHNQWLNYLQPVSIGLVFSPNALRVAQFIPDASNTTAQKALAPLTRPLPQLDDGTLSLHALENPPRVFTSAWAVLTEYLGWNPDLIDCFTPGPAAQMIPAAGSDPFLLSPANTRPGQAFTPVPEPLQVVLQAWNHDTLEPHFALRWAPGKKPDDAGSPLAILGLVVPHQVDLDRKPQVDLDYDYWAESPQKKFERLLNDTGVPIGLIVHGKALRLVYKPQNQTSGYISFPIDPLLKPAGRLACTALQGLLNHQRVQVLNPRQRLHTILDQSRKFQNEVSTELADQVLAALFELLKGFQEADERSRNQLLKGLRDNPDQTSVIYDALLTVLMRLVFLLYAEERDMFPADAVFSNHYSISGLFARLVEDESQFPDTMDLRYGAWAHLVALFRVMHDGINYTPADLAKPQKVLPRKGYLFDPARFPFLEGRAGATVADHEPALAGTAELPLVSDGVVLRVLRNLLYLHNERLSYRSLEVEQIGSVYEAIMGFTVETTTGRSVAIRAEKRGGAPTILNLDAVLEAKPDKRAELIKEATDRKLPAKASADVKAARSLPELHAALDKVIDKRLTPEPVPAGSLLFQPSPERRRSGSHYTPRALTEPIVKKALEPILRRLGSSPAPEQILALKVCDPAMGSGAFLVEAMRQLADSLLLAWKEHGCAHTIPGDETPFLYACRLIAQRCLYGVDKNPMAVGLAKLSLWLATLARDHAFTFLDHNLRHGDSLVGLSLANLEACHWASTLEQGFVGQSMRQRIQTAMAERAKILTADETTSYEKLLDLRNTADKPLDFVRFLANAVVGVFFEGGKEKAMELRRKALANTIRDYLSDRVSDQEKLITLRPEIEANALTLARCQPPVVPFHWEMEFPEVFLTTAADGSIERSPTGGFDMIVGNPPFAGKNTLAEANAKGYPDWLKVVHPESHGNADLVAHFFRRSFSLVRPGGSFGLIATNTIAQGDTRSTGLRWICHHGGVIYAARKRLKWPGEAAVVVSTVHIAKPFHEYDNATPTPELDGRPAEKITAFLFPKGGHDDPARLHANAGKSFVGSYVLGMGFTFDDTDNKGKASPITRARADALGQSGPRPISMEELIEKDPRNRERIFPYIGGEEVNTSPTHAYHRYVINFGEMTLEQAGQWPDLLKIVEERVKPERMIVKDKGAKEKWWQFIRTRPELHNAIRGLERVLVISRIGNACAFAWLKNAMVFNEKTIVFPLDKDATISLFQSRIHEVWVRFFSSTLKDDLQYTPSLCLETFPFPENWEKNNDLEAAGKAYYEFRAELMVETNKGLTKTYNDFHDPEIRTPGIEKLRTLHAAMDTAVLAAYGWPDIDTTCGFDLDYCDVEPNDDATPETLDRLERGDYWFATAEEATDFAQQLGTGAESHPWRYRWRPEVRDDVLARLLLLNKERAEAERQAGLTTLTAADTDDDEYDE